ncbi:MAG TPA: peptide-methionine (R)-S-oxide reductase MsrB [Candidatus Baltobacteraceae bacterium]|jgi:peptide-methionine (R)-S-oxide reductase|nr:peptide-methionine (R)-S-oxide reductase MsrB [Candidatus Baltobacteraceae bacterium]
MDRAELDRTPYSEPLTRAAWLRALAILGAASLTGATQRDQTADERAYVMWQNGTEPPYSSPLNGETRAGLYHCANCELALFSSTTKYDAHEGWPSFYAPLPNAITTGRDYDIGYARTEVHCRRCKGHLGHVFDDGPPPTGLRYCIDGVALHFVPGATTPPDSHG